MAHRHKSNASFELPFSDLLAATPPPSDLLGGAPTRLSDAEIDEAAANLVASAPASIEDFSDIASDLLELVQSATGAAGCALFRSVHDTGLLVPAGRTANLNEANSETNRIVNAISRAADTTASIFANELQKRGEIDPVLASSRRIFHRRVPGPCGLVIYSLAIVRPPTRAESDGERPGPRLPVQPIRTPLLGVWVAVLPDDSTTGLPIEDRRNMETQLRRFHVYIRLLCRQQVLIEAAETAYRQTEKRIREVATIYEIGKAVDSSEIDELLELITKKAADVMDAQACSLMLKDGNTDQLVIAASSGLPDEVVENTRVFIGQGIAGRVAETGEPLLVNYDVRSDPRFQDARMRGLPGISSSIVMPMKDEWDQVNGILCIRRRTPAPPFTPDDERLFSIFASQASMAIKSARLYGQLRSRVTELSTLSSLTEAISSTLDPDLVLNQVADNLIQVVGFDRCLLYLRGGANDELVWSTPRIMRGFDHLVMDNKLKQRLQLPDATSLIVNIAERQVPVLVDESDHTLPMARDYAEVFGLKSFYAQPIIVRNETIAVVVVTTDLTGRPLALANMDLLVTFLQHAGIAIENARLYKQMELRVRELDGLYTMSRSLATTYGLSKSCATVNRVAAEISHSDIGLLMLFNERMDALRVHSSEGAPEVVTNLLRVLQDATDVSRYARQLREPTLFAPSADDEQRLCFGKSWSKLVASIEDHYPNLLLVPLVTEEASVGFMLLGRGGDMPYEDGAGKLLSIIASHAAAVLRSAAIYEHSIEQRVLELSALYEVSKKVRNARSMGDAFGAIVDIVKSVMMCDAAYVYVIDPVRRELTIQSHYGEKPLSNSPEPIDSSQTIVSWVARERKAVLTADVTSDPRFPSAHFGPSVRSLMMIPIVLADDTLGVLQVQSTARNMYTEDNVKMLSLITAQAAALYREMQSLRELTTYTDNILHSIAAGVVTLDATGRIVTFNQAAERVLRLEAKRVAGMRFEELVPLLGGDPADEQDTLKMVAMANETGGTVQRHRLRYYSSNGTLGPGDSADEVVVNGSASQLRSERGEYLGVVMVFEDVTKELEMEQELLRVSRLAEIGQLAAGIAHELRNPLASIKGAAQLLKTDLPEEKLDRHREFLDIIVNEVNVLNGVTTEIVEFARPATPQLALLDVNDLLSRRIAFLRSEFESADVAVRLSLAPGLPELKADAGMLERAVTNIVLNAVQAMPDGGLLTISTRTVGTGADFALELSFEDTGIGIEPSKISTIFAPFFTTKTKGTGLGLAIVQKIVDSHDGRIRAQSVVGKGTTFTIWLPVSSPFRDKVHYAVDGGAEITQQRLHAAKRMSIEEAADR